MKNNVFPENAPVPPVPSRGRPTLAPATDADRFSEHGILSKLNSNPDDRSRLTRNNRRRGLMFAAGAGLVVLAGFLAFQFVSGRASSSESAQLAGDIPSRSQAPENSKTEAPGVTPAALAYPAPAVLPGGSGAPPLLVPPPLVAAAPAGPAAQIVNEPPPALGKPDVLAQAPAVASSQKTKSSSSSPTLGQPLESKSAASVKTASDKSKDKAKSPVAPKKQLAKTEISKKSVAVNMPVEKQTPADKDVNLLAALLAHDKNGGSDTAAAVKTGSSARTTVKSESAKSPAGPTVDKSARLDQANRDVVTRKAGESTDALLKRCSALGFIENQLCRLRICSGQWETDTACKASLSGAATPVSSVIDAPSQTQ